MGTFSRVFALLISAFERGQQGDQERGELRLDARARFHHLFMVDGLIENARRHIGYAGDAEHFDSHMPGHNGFVHRGHADQVGAPTAKGANFCRSFEAGPGKAEIHAFGQLNPVLGGDAVWASLTQASCE